MDAGQTRVQDYDIEIIGSSPRKCPVILVFTQTIDDQRADELEATIRDVDLRSRAAARCVHSREQRRIGHQTLQAERS